MYFTHRFLMGLASASLAFMTSLTPANGSGLDRLDDWAEAKGWEGVGLLMMNGNSSCTGALIRPDLVLTAAHCLYDQADQPIQPSRIEFRAAWRDGQAISRRVGKRALAHHGYSPVPRPTSDSIFHDMALLQLDMPVRGDIATPFDMGSAPQSGARLTVVSYGSGRNDAASLEEACRLVEDRGGVYAMSCSVVPGSSGSPVFAQTPNGPRIISVISALGFDGTAYGMDALAHIDTLLADFDAGIGVYPAVVQSVRRLSVASNDGTPKVRKLGNGGALFLKP